MLAGAGGHGVGEAALVRARTVLQAMGHDVHDDEPDLSGADEAFETWRALAYASSYSPLLRTHRSSLKEIVLWNIEQELAHRAPRTRCSVRVHRRRFADRDADRRGAPDELLVLQFAAGFEHATGHHTRGPELAAAVR